MRILYIAGLLIGLSIAAFGQQLGTVSGRAHDGSRDGNGITQLTVTLTSIDNPNITFTAMTEDAGSFVFEKVTPGKYHISANERLSSVSMSGEQIIAVVAGQNPPIELIVRPNAIRESVTVSAAQVQPIEQVSKTVDVIEGQEMRDRADFTLIDTVRTIPGFRVQQLGGFGRTASIKARGLRNQDTAVLIDGIRFRDAASITGDASPFLSDFTLTSVDRIEVLRGSGSSLYGTNAIGGALDFRTPRPVRGVHGQVSGTAGGLGLGRFRGNLSYGTSDNKLGVSGAVSRTAYTKGIDGDDNASNTSFQSRVEYNPFITTNISGRFFFSDAKVRLNSSPDTLGVLPPPAGIVIDANEGVNFVPDVDDPDSLQNSRFFVGQFAISHIVNKKLVVSGSYQGLTSKRTNEDGPLGVGFQSAFTSIFGGAIHTANAHAIWTPTPSNTLTAGYEFEDEHFNNEGGTPDPADHFTTNATQRSHTLYVQH
ncbi:MAG: TonB-dependent receptor, partial [Acidobacteriota bacterium]